MARPRIVCPAPLSHIDRAKTSTPLRGTREQRTEMHFRECVATFVGGYRDERLNIAEYRS